MRAPESNQALFKTNVHMHPNSHVPDLTLAASVVPGVESKIMFETAPENGAVDEALHRFLIEIQDITVPSVNTYTDIHVTGRIGFRFPKPESQLPQFQRMVHAFVREWLVAYKRQRATCFRLERRELFGTRRMDDRQFLEEHLGVPEGQRLYRELWQAK